MQEQRDFYLFILFPLETVMTSRMKHLIINGATTDKAQIAQLPPEIVSSAFVKDYTFSINL